MHSLCRTKLNIWSLQTEECTWKGGNGSLASSYKARILPSTDKNEVMGYLISLYWQSFCSPVVTPVKITVFTPVVIMKSCRALAGLLYSTWLAAALVARAPANPGNDTGTVIRNQGANQTFPNKYLIAFKSGLSNDVINAKEAEINATISKRNVNKRSLDSRQLSVESFPFRIDDKTRGLILDADDATIQALARSEETAFIEADVVGSRDSIVSQQNATTNLVRLSHNKADGFSTYDYDETAGQGITVYVLDGGIRLTHDEFRGRATFGASFSAEPGVSRVPQQVHWPFY